MHTFSILISNHHSDEFEQICISVMCCVNADHFASMLFVKLLLEFCLQSQEEQFLGQRCKCRVVFMLVLVQEDWIIGFQL